MSATNRRRAAPKRRRAFFEISTAVGAALTLAQGTAAAQRSDENAVTAAEDAFGVSVGNENIGLYNPFEVRGFSAIDAGNARIDGLYFDQQIDPVTPIVEGSTMRVGISAQGYPLPAPTGIVDYSIRRAGDKPVYSVYAAFGAYEQVGVELTTSTPIIENRLAIAAGGALYRSNSPTRATSLYGNIGVAPRWTPTDGIEIIPFFSRSWSSGGEADPLVFVAGPFLPPRVSRSTFYGQEWAENENVGTNAGVLGKIAFGDRTTFRTGLFRSAYVAHENFADLFVNVDPQGAGDHFIIADKDLKFASTSGEARLTHDFAPGGEEQLVHLVVRARDQKRRYGGSDIVDLGSGSIGVPAFVSEPVFVFGPQTRDHVRQLTVAAAYQGRVFDRLELSAGLQKAFYEKTTLSPGSPTPSEGEDSPFLYNGAAALHVDKKLAFYASYARGLEEGGVAPAVAVNKDAASPALITRQIDAGFRYAFSDELRLVAGVFDVRKPYFNLDAMNFYRELGEFRQRGIEMSLTGSPVKGLTLVAGNLLLQPRVTGEEVDQGLIGERPVGQTNRLTIVSADYQLPFAKGFSVNGTLTSVGDRVASRDNQLSIPARSVVDLGARYRFKIGAAPAQLSLRVGNITNKFGWRTNASEVFVPNGQRRVSVDLAADF